MKAKTFFSTLILFFCFQNAAYTETLNLLTEDYPPFNMRTNGKHEGDPNDLLTGISVDMVREIMKRAEIPFTIQIYPWKRAYETARERSGYGVFSTFRTPERESLFRWVGPLVENNWILMGRKDRNFRITSLEDVRQYDIGGYRGDAIAEFLEKNGCRLQYTTYDHLNAKKLAAGRIDLWATGHLLGPYFAKQQEVEGLEPVFQIRESAMYLALNPSVSEDAVNLLNGILEEIRGDNTAENILARYR